MRSLFVTLLLLSGFTFFQVNGNKYEVITSLGTLKDTSATIRSIIVSERVRAYYADTSIKDRIRVILFDLTILRGASDTLHNSIHSNGNLLSADQKEVINKCIKGDKLIFLNIRGIGGSGKDRILTPFFIVVK